MKIPQKVRELAKSKRRIALILVGFVIIVGAVFGLALKHGNDAGPNTQAQMEALVSEVGKIIVLPTNEEPTVATVTNAANVSKQPFFIHAQKGDKVLIYANNQLAILYRPSAHKIINVGPINGTVSYAKASITVRNGTTNPGFTTAVDTKLTASFPNAKILENAAASRSNFPTTIVIPLNDGSQDLAAQIADTIGGQVGIMPTGEDEPTSDILIIIGQDYRQ